MLKYFIENIADCGITILLRSIHAWYSLIISYMRCSLVSRPSLTAFFAAVVFHGCEKAVREGLHEAMCNAPYKLAFIAF